MDLLKRIVFLVGIAIVFLSFHYRQTSREIIIWSKDRPLIWNDFKGRVDKKSIHGATSHLGINKLSFLREDSVFLNICSEFYPKESWVRPTEQSSELLKHEQGHFDIRELFARKLRKYFLTTSFKEKGLKELVVEAFNNNWVDMNKYDSLYDAETNHNMIILKQKEWENKIAQELNTLNDYTNVSLKLLLEK